MRRQIALRAALLVPAILAFWMVVAPSASAGNPCFHGFVIPPVTTEAANQIKVAPCAFAPTIAQVPTGSTVTFFNGPDFTHLITGASQAWGSPEVEVQPMSETSFTFDRPGIYPYACVLHPGMSGAIVVGDVASVLAAGTTGTGGGATGGEPAAETTTAATTEAGSSPPIGTLASVTAGVVSGLAVGAGAAWLALRRRTSKVEPLVRAD